MPENKQLEVLTNHLLPSEIITTPSQIEKQYLKPDFTHTIAMISGYDGEREHVAQVDGSGALKVNTAASGYLHYVVVSNTYSSTTPSAANIVFDDYIDELDLTVKDNPVNIRLTDSTTGQFGDTFELPTGFTQINYVTKAIMIWCNVSGSTSTVQVVGWW